MMYFICGGVKSRGVEPLLFLNVIVLLYEISIVEFLIQSAAVVPSTTAFGRTSLKSKNALMTKRT